MPVKSNVKKSASTKHVVANSSASVNRLYCGPLGPATQKPSAAAGGFCLLSSKFVMDVIVLVACLLYNHGFHHRFLDLLLQLLCFSFRYFFFCYFLILFVSVYF